MKEKAGLAQAQAASKIVTKLYKRQTKAPAATQPGLQNMVAQGQGRPGNPKAKA